MNNKTILEKASQLVKEHVLWNVHELTSLLISENENFLENFIRLIDGEDTYQFWLVDEWLYHRLNNKAEKVATYVKCYFWCRTTVGQAIKRDSIIQDIANEYY